jgi:flagellar assembly protein FliH
MSSDVKTEEVSKAEAVAPLVYLPAPGWEGADGNGGEQAALVEMMGAGLGIATGVARQSEAEAREKQLLEKGFREGLAKGRAEAESAMLQQRERVSQALQEFRREREKYFHQVEGEIVALALAIVRKILRREAHTDPLLLAGLVRVALEKMTEAQNVRMRVHPAQIPAWQDYFAKQTESPLAPELSGDASLAADQCALETQHETTELSLETQLKEIEQGLLDLLAQRPEPK